MGIIATFAELRDEFIAERVTAPQRPDAGLAWLTNEWMDCAVTDDTAL